VRILVIGGTRFVGRYIAQEALSRGHQLVLFNRGRTNPDLFPEATHVRGDRKTGGLELLAGQSFDAVFDTAAYHPDDVSATASLASQVAHYSLVSTVSVYRDPVARLADETAPLWTLDGPLPSEFSTVEEYGGLKAQCEVKASQIYAERALIIRPGLIIGPHDYTDRLTSWIRRLHHRKALLAGEADQPIQVIDVRDLAEWMIRVAESHVSGVYNAVGPEKPITFKDLLASAAEAIGASARVVWAGDRFLAGHAVALPLWLPRRDHSFFELSSARALASGLTFRDLTHTLNDVKVWADSRLSRDARDALPAARTSFSPNGTSYRRRAPEHGDDPVVEPELIGQGTRRMCTRGAGRR